MSNTNINQPISPKGLSQTIFSTQMVGFQLFTTRLRSIGRNAVYCFVEGEEDDDYYKSRVEVISARLSEFIPCKGKDNVLYTYSFLKKRTVYTQFLKLWFVDRDYDPLIGNPEIYETDGYAIENFYTGKEFITNFLEKEWSIEGEKDKEEVEEILKEYEIWENDFIEAMRNFISWYRIGKYNFPRNNNYFGKDIPVTILEFNDKGIEDKGVSLDFLNSQYPPKEGMAPVSIEQWEQQKPGLKKIEDIRGKFVLHFIDEFLRHTRNRVNRKRGNKEKKYENNRKTMMIRLSPYAITPTKLISYIQNRLQP